MSTDCKAKLKCHNLTFSGLKSCVLQQYIHLSISYLILFSRLMHNKSRKNFSAEIKTIDAHREGEMGCTKCDQMSLGEGIHTALTNDKMNERGAQPGVDPTKLSFFRFSDFRC